jgi:SnoaL-like protein
MENKMDILRELAGLTARIRELEDIERIKELQLRYWRAVDQKNPEMLRSLFSPGTIHIEFEGMQTWLGRDEFVQTFIELGMDPARQENHFGLNPIIKLSTADAANATWRLFMFAYNDASRTVIRISGMYDAEYVRHEGAWLITTLIFRRHSIYSEQIGEDGKVEVPDFGQVSVEAAAHLFGRSDAAQ